MKTKNDYISLLKSCGSELKQQFGVRSLHLFGSVARNEQKETSDIDIYVETETPNPFLNSKNESISGKTFRMFC